MTVKQAKPQGQVSLGMLLLKGRTFIALAILLLYFSFRAPNFTEWGSVVLMVKHDFLIARKAEIDVPRGMKVLRKKGFRRAEHRG